MMKSPSLSVRTGIKTSVGNLKLKDLHDKLVEGNFNKKIEGKKRWSDATLLKKCYDGSSDFIQANPIPPHVVDEFIRIEIKRLEDELSSGKFTASWVKAYKPLSLTKPCVHPNVGLILDANKIKADTLYFIRESSALLLKCNTTIHHRSGTGSGSGTEIIDTVNTKNLVPIDKLIASGATQLDFSNRYNVRTDGSIIVRNPFYENRDDLTNLLSETNKYLEEKGGILNVFPLEGSNGKIGRPSMSLLSNLFNLAATSKDTSTEFAFKKAYYNSDPLIKTRFLGSFNQNLVSDQLAKFLGDEFVKHFFQYSKSNLDFSMLKLNEETLDKILDLYEKFPETKVKERLTYLLNRTENWHDKILDFVVEYGFSNKDTVTKVINILNTKDVISEKERFYLNSLIGTENELLLISYNKLYFDTAAILYENAKSVYEGLDFKGNNGVFLALSKLEGHIPNFQEELAYLVEKMDFRDAMNAYSNFNKLVSFGEIFKERIIELIPIVSDDDISHYGLELLEFGLLDTHEVMSKYLMKASSQIDTGTTTSVFPLWDESNDRIKSFYFKLISHHLVSKKHILKMPKEAILNNLSTIVQKGIFSNSEDVISLFKASLSKIDADKRVSFEDSFVDTAITLMSVPDNLKETVSKILYSLIKSSTDSKFTFDVALVDEIILADKINPIFIREFFRGLYEPFYEFYCNSDNLPILMVLFEINGYKEILNKRTRSIRSMKFTQKALSVMDKKKIPLNLRFLEMLNGHGQELAGKKIPLSKTNFSIDDIKTVEGFIKFHSSFELQDGVLDSVIDQVISNFDKFKDIFKKSLNERSRDRLGFGSTVIKDFFLEKVLVRASDWKFDPKYSKQILEILEAVSLDSVSKITSGDSNGKNFNKIVNIPGFLLGYSAAVTKVGIPTANTFLLNPTGHVTHGLFEPLLKKLKDNRDLLTTAGYDLLIKVVAGLLREMPHGKITVDTLKDFYKYLTPTHKMLVLQSVKISGNKELLESLLSDKIANVQIFSLISTKSYEGLEVPFIYKNDNSLYVSLKDTLGFNGSRLTKDSIVSELKTEVSGVLPKSILNLLANTDNSAAYVNSLSQLYSFFITDLSIDEENQVISDFNEVLKNEGINNLFYTHIHPVMVSSGLSSIGIVTKLKKLVGNEGVKTIGELMKN